MKAAECSMSGKTYNGSASIGKRYGWVRCPKCGNSVRVSGTTRTYWKHKGKA